MVPFVWKSERCLDNHWFVGEIMENEGGLEKRTACPLDCPDTCGMIAQVVDGRVSGLRGDPDHPYTRGVICRKMLRYHERLYREDRILHPMKRAGKKGDGRFERITWDEAYACLTGKITEICKKYGGGAILPFCYAGNMGAVNRFAGYPLFNKLGASRLEETICSSAAKIGWVAQCGDVPGTSPDVAENAELICIWGSNTKVTNMHFWPYVAAAKKRGAKLLVIDPYRNMTAASGDMHIKLLPGTDAALALGVFKVLLENSNLDERFISECTTGFDDLKSYLYQTSLDMFSHQCGVAPEEIAAMARVLGATEKIFFRLGIGMTRNSRAAMSVRAITSLAAGLGLFDGGDGRGVLLTSGAFKGDSSLLTWPSLSRGERRTFNMVQLAHALGTASPPVKMLFVYNSNPLSVTPDGSHLRQSLMNEELFTVVHEQVMTPTARYSDLLLPATTFLENRDLYTGYGHFYMSVVDTVVEPLAECKSNFTLFQELARKLDFNDPPFLQSLDERLMEYLGSMDGVPDGVDVSSLPSGFTLCSSRKENQGFGRQGLKFSFSQRLDPEQPRFPCLTRGGEFDDCDLATRYPFRLITPPHINLLNSTFGERYEGQDGEVMIHPQDAASLGVETGDMVTLYNDRGWHRRSARVTDATQLGLLVAEGIFWQSGSQLSGVNDLTSQKLTDMGGGGTFHETRVGVLAPKNTELQGVQR